MRSFQVTILRAAATALFAFSFASGASAQGRVPTNSTERPAPALATHPVDPTAATPHGGDLRRTVGWTLCGAGTVGAAIGGALAFVAKSEHDDAAAATGSARAADLQEAGRLTTSAAILLAAGGAAAVSGVVVLLTAPRVDAAIGTNGREILVSGTF